MKFTLSWLKDHLDTNADIDTIADTLTAIGLEVEDVTDNSVALKEFIVAEIRHAEPHPNASKLRVCRVFDGEVERQIVCGAPNARAGIKVVLAREGVLIPANGMVIKKTKIRDVESNGMLCSAEELGLDGDSEGIIELPVGTALGSSAAAALGADDPVIEINVTPNRADALGVYGIARDLAATGLGTLKALPLEGGGLGGGEALLAQAECHPLPNPPPSRGREYSVSLDTPHCSCFIGVRIEGVTNRESPDWLKRRLTAIGLRPISALVDITNYMAFTYARPLHVFDAKKVNGQLQVRPAKDGETLEALNDKTYTLKDGMTVIADASGALAIGGVIGGKASGCTEATTDVILEAALFDPANIAQTGRALDIISDARYRFERGIDPAFVEAGAALATQMILDICGGTVTAFSMSGAIPNAARKITFDPESVRTLGGIELSADQSIAILKKLGFTISGSDTIPPSWRADVEGAADLVEEVLRIHGYDNLAAVPLPKLSAINQQPLSAEQLRAKRTRTLLATRGLLEVCAYTFIGEDDAKRFGFSNGELKLLNPISPEHAVMRPSILPSLLIAARANQYRGIGTLSLFEVGLQYTDITPQGQHMSASGLRAGFTSEHTYPDTRFSAAERPFDVFDAKADALAVLNECGVKTESLSITRNVPSWYHPGRSGALTLGKTVLGYFGELHPAHAMHYDIKGGAAVFEILLDAIPASKTKGKAPLAASPYPPVMRDFAFTVDASIAVGDILRAASGVDKTLIRETRVFDVFAGKNVAEGKKSVAFSVTMQSSERTLTEEDITALSKKIVDAVTTACGAELRQ